MSEENKFKYSNNSECERKIREMNQHLITLQKRAEAKRQSENARTRSSLIKEFFEGLRID